MYATPTLSDAPPLLYARPLNKLPGAEAILAPCRWPRGRDRSAQTESRLRDYSPDANRCHASTRGRSRGVRSRKARNSSVITPRRLRGARFALGDHERINARLKSRSRDRRVRGTAFIGNHLSFAKSRRVDGFGMRSRCCAFRSGTYEIMLMLAV